LNFEQKNDIIWITSPEHYPRTLKRYSDTSWELEDFKLKNKPFYENGDNSITVECTDVLDGILEISANAEIFTEKMVGAEIIIYSQRKNTAVNKTFTADGESASLQIIGSWHLLSTGTWVGKVYLERSFDGGESWEHYREYASNANNNIDASGYETEAGVLYRCRFEGWEDAPSGVLYECRITLSMDEGQTANHAVITEFISGGSVKCTADTTFRRIESTSDWAIEAWNDEYGYPKTVAFTSWDRLAFANTRKQPQTIWLSQVSNYDNFYNDTQADSALTWTIETNLYNEINWIINSKKLLVGLANEIGSLSGKDENKPMTIDNRKYEPEIELSAADIPPVKANETMLLLRRGKRTLVELSYNWESEGFVAPDMTLLSPDVLQGRVRQTAYQEQPYPVVWFVMDDGSCASFTYNRAENVTAWAKHETSGSYRSVARLANEIDSDDVYFAVERANGVFVEHLAHRTEDINKMVYTDCSVITENSAGAADITEVTLSQFANMEVTALLDGSPVRLTADGNGRIEFPFAAVRAVVGLSYESYIETLPFEMMQGLESTFANKKTAQNIVAKFYKSIGGEFSVDGENYSPVISRRTSVNLGEALQPQSYTLDMALRSTYQYETVLRFRQREPLPVTLLAVEVDVQ
jgi:phosphoribosyl-AMP cyclohydrolase